MEMKAKNFALLLLLSLVAICTGYEDNKKPKLFVIGDSFADTGNMGNRSSDGLILTDYIASFLGIKAPVIYIQRNKVSKLDLQDGMNFARSGSGVLKASFTNYPMTLQVATDFKEQIAQNVYTKYDVKNSIALVSYSGNDYLFKSRIPKATMQDVFDLTQIVVDLLTKNLREIRDLGVRKIGIFGVPPRGCFPNFYDQTLRICDETWNKASKRHNNLLKKSLENLNKERNGSKIVYLDLYNAFNSALFDKNTGSVGSENRFKACCVKGPMNKTPYCGTRPGDIICKHPKLSIFWDEAHPSQNGANVIYSSLVTSLNHLL